MSYVIYAAYGSNLLILSLKSWGIKPKARIPSSAQRYKDIPVENLFPWEVCQSIF